MNETLRWTFTVILLLLAVVGPALRLSGDALQNRPPQERFDWQYLAWWAVAAYWWKP
jgi:hypothetical protein